MSERLYPSPRREARLERRQSRAENRRYRVDYDLAYDGGGSEWRRVVTNLHDARIEAAARALFHDPLASGDYTWEEMVAEDNSRAELWRDDARRVLAAADAIQSKAKLSQNFALPTVEMIAEVIHPGYGRTDGYCASCALAKDQARKIAALFGEVAGDE